MGRPLSNRVRVALGAPSITHTKPRAGWQDAAACADADPTMFDLGEPGTEQQQTYDREAVEMCGGCPVRLDCLLGSLAFEIVDGSLIAGMTTRQRELFAQAHPELVTWTGRYDSDRIDEEIIAARQSAEDFDVFEMAGAA